ncbi:MAG: FTR1 family protein [Porticoccaceae bacterium]
MLIDSVIIVSREIIEAAFLVSVLLAVTNVLRLSATGFRSAALLGLCSAVLFSLLLPRVFDWFGGVGYELANVGVQLLTYLAILAILAILGQQRFGPPSSPRTQAVLRWAMAAAVVLAMTREGAEILLYFGSLSAQEGATSDAVTGAVIGIGVGFSAGTLFYYLQLAQRPSAALATGAVLLALIGSGMCAQATQLLIQADWLPAQAPLWNSSRWLPESSPLGQLLYALIGYEATPSPLVVGIYLASMIIALTVALGGRRQGAKALARRRQSAPNTLPQP